MKYFLTILLGVLTFGLSFAQVNPPTTSSFGVQELNILTVTNKGSAQESTSTLNNEKGNKSNVVMKILNKSFSNQGRYSDFIWIKPGSLRDESILPEDIEGGFTAVTGLINTGTCLDIEVGDSSISGFVIGFTEDRNIICAQSTDFKGYRSAGAGGSTHREGGNSSIHIGSNGIGTDSSAVTVAGVAKIAGSSAKISLLEDGGIPVTIKQNSINTKGKSFVKIGKIGQHVGIGVAPDPDASLYVKGDIITQGSWSVSDAGKTNTLRISPDANGTTIIASKPLILTKNKKSASVASFSQIVHAAGKSSFSLSLSCTYDVDGCALLIDAPGSSVSSVKQNDVVISSVGGGKYKYNTNVALKFSLFLSGQPYTVSCGDTFGSCAISPSSQIEKQVDGQGFDSTGVTFSQFFKDDVRVMMGYTPSTSHTPKANLTVQGGINTKGLQLSNLTPSNRSYKTLKQVDCKVLTLNSGGEMQLVDFHPEICGRGEVIPPKEIYTRKKVETKCKYLDSLCSGSYKLSGSPTTAWKCHHGGRTEHDKKNVCSDGIFYPSGSYVERDVVCSDDNPDDAVCDDTSVRGTAYPYQGQSCTVASNKCGSPLVKSCGGPTTKSSCISQNDSCSFSLGGWTSEISYNCIDQGGDSAPGKCGELPHDNGKKKKCSMSVKTNGKCPVSLPDSSTKPTARCAIGTPTSVTGSGPWSWKCNGINGGNASVNCTVKETREYGSSKRCGPCLSNNDCGRGLYCSSTHLSLGNDKSCEMYDPPKDTSGNPIECIK